MSNEEKILSILEEHSKQFEHINTTLETHSGDIKVMKSSISKINNTLETHSEDIKVMKSSIINTEAYVREKIPTLFDAITVNSNKHDIYDDHIASLNAKTFNHNIRISALEDTLRPLSA